MYKYYCEYPNQVDMSTSDQHTLIEQSVNFVTLIEQSNIGILKS